MAPRPVLVTGATGFVGSALVPALRAEGRDVLALARPSAQRAHLAGEGVTWLEGDLERPETIARAVARAAEAARAAGRELDVVHGGALISYRRADRERAVAVNVGGTRALLDALVAEGARGGIGRLCHVSSIVAVGWSHDPGQVLDEESPFPAEELGCHYVATKRAAEELVLARVDALDAVVVNPGAIFGAAPTVSNTLRLLERLRDRGGVPLAPPGSIAPVGLGDVARGILAALRSGRRGRRYLLVESHCTHADLLARAAALLGVRPPRWTVPPVAWRALTVALALVDRVSPRTLLTPTAARHLGLHYRFDASRARRELGWTPEPLDTVLAGAVAALAGEGSGGVYPGSS